MLGQRYYPRPLKVDEKIYLAQWTGAIWKYMQATVTKITAKGQISAQIGTAEPMRFHPDGRRWAQTHSSFEYEIDWMPFEERTAFVEREARRKAAANAVYDLNGKNTYHWSKESLQAEVDKFQALVDAARAKVNAI